MAAILKGAPVVAAMNEANAARCAALSEKGIVPTLAVVRVGGHDDLAGDGGRRSGHVEAGGERSVLARRPRREVTGSGRLGGGDREDHRRHAGGRHPAVGEHVAPDVGEDDEIGPLDLGDGWSSAMRVGRCVTASACR